MRHLNLVERNCLKGGQIVFSEQEMTNLMTKFVTRNVSGLFQILTLAGSHWAMCNLNQGGSNREIFINCVGCTFFVVLLMCFKSLVQGGGQYCLNMSYLPMNYLMGR